MEPTPIDPFIAVFGSGRRPRGRPPSRTPVKTERVEFLATKDEKHDLQRIAEAEGKPLATIVREAVNEFVADYADGKVFGSN